MIPAGSTIKNAPVQEVQQPSLTWKLDFEKNRITGRIDELEAVKQAVLKILQTERFRYLIYSFNFGSELESLIGSNEFFVQSEASRMLQEALSQDDRIQGIENVRVVVNGDSILLEFRVMTTYGAFQASQEVI